MQTFAVFGGTGFLGRRVVRHLARQHKVRVISRHSEQGRDTSREEARIEPVQADVNDGASVRSAVTGAIGVVNAVSLYVEHGGQTFRSVHGDAAARVARISRECGVSRLVHVSGVGADSRSRSPYIRSRGEGEKAVRAAFPAATIVRPCVMFGPDDAFLTPLVGLLRKSPVLPLFGRGRTLLQPSHVDDVAEAIARILDTPKPAAIYEFGGPDILSYEDLLRTIATHIGVKRVFLPMPFAAWHALAFFSEMLPQPLITRNQVELMKIDNIASSQFPGFRDFGIEPQDIGHVAAAIG
ncbi:NADH dehydrogenase [Pseudorhodoplanes sinuspersici]|uniref:Epimerase n=1 Tax=Pseudorhodoplanes sinuspersici TaxID=1235591 RepID=A0A1W7A1C4_9HYPH|nr:epimerase [Pseudorhodoplanes sinuspersici]RKE69643.1 NADH dehydrogenase [Pseudorhodoplanes sinuspersici]